MSENHLTSLKRMKEISKMIEATLQQNNRLKNILASELYFRKKCEASLEIVNSTTDEQECYRKVSKMKPREILMKELNEEIAQYNKHTPHLVVRHNDSSEQVYASHTGDISPMYDYRFLEYHDELRKKLIDKLSNLKEQYLQTHETGIPVYTYLNVVEKGWNEVINAFPREGEEKRSTNKLPGKISVQHRSPPCVVLSPNREKLSYVGRCIEYHSPGVVLAYKMNKKKKKVEISFLLASHVSSLCHQLNHDMPLSPILRV
ncbi:conserved Plasmodium protein, unknown function [Plasmodium ovale curtisi]|uniref:Uncharacterized protein n=1 Tax=Plasmodium ovale curtisi TaxID=864141 RepID=A0A1A8VZ44_PLAOA|nr:conserved Plasmodium protein, unknown function [Plasmodium ovale curtisi]